MIVDFTDFALDDSDLAIGDMYQARVLMPTTGRRWMPSSPSRWNISMTIGMGKIAGKKEGTGSWAGKRKTFIYF